MLSAKGDLSRAPVEWLEFLSRLGEDHASAEQRFIARNFLLDEGVGADRARSYLERGAKDGYVSAEDWGKAHGRYLAEVVHRVQSGGLPRRLDPADDACPETFQRVPDDSPFLRAHPNLLLIRVERVDSIALIAKRPSQEVSAALKSYLEKGEQDDEIHLRDILEEWNANADVRPTFSAFLDDFRAAGFDPGAVDLVVCTHMHVDHVGWNTRLVDGAWLPTFANARYIFAQREYDYWQAESGREDAATEAPEGIPAHGAAFDDSVAPIVAAGRADLVDAEHRLSASLRLTSSAGHTPGHVTLEVRSGGTRALLIGDAMHSPVQCAAPDARPALDTPEFAPAARARRRAILEDVADTEAVIAGSHFPPPGFGRVLRDAGAFRFQPVGG